MTKARITVTVDEDLLNWLDKKIKNYVYANRSHGMEVLVADAVKETNK